MKLSRLFSVIILFALFGCQQDYSHYDNLNNENDLTIVDIKKLFEDKYADYLTRGYIVENDHKVIVPDDYTPIWDNATQYNTQDQWFCEIPILSSQKLWAERHDHKGTYHTRIDQKLVVIKNKDSNVSSLYIMTIIPDRKYIGRSISNIYNIADSKNFSGLILFSSLKQQLIKIAKYEDGAYCTGAYMYDNSINYQQKADLINFLLLGTTIMAYDEITRGGDDVTMVYENGEWVVRCNYCNGSGCSHCIVYVEPERCEKCGEISNNCICNSDSEENKDPEPEEDPIIDEGDSENNNSGSGNSSNSNRIQTFIIIDTSNDSFDEAKNIVFNQISHSQLFDQIKDIRFNVQIIKDDILSPAQLSFYVYQSTGLIDAIMQINDTYYNEMSSMGQIITVLHELYHAYLFVENRSENEPAHDIMIENPDYIHYIEMLFPDQSDEFYKKMSYAGTQLSDTYRNLSDDDKSELESFFDEYGIYY